MLLYLDMCCLKRPFDDQRQPRIRLETEAVLQLLGLESEHVQFVRSAALFLENSFNPLPERAARVADWLRASPALPDLDSTVLEARIETLQSLGLKAFDALHLATAELANADRFVTTDDRLLKAAARRPDSAAAKAILVIDCLQELLR